jgi:hypothetical protein
MKKLLGLIGLALILFIASCTKGNDSADPRDQLAGTWSCRDSSTTHVFGTQTFTVNIKKSASDNSNIIVSNFNNLGTDRNAIIAVSGTNLTIPTQIIDVETVNGSGSSSSSGSAINLRYNVNDGQSKDVVISVMTKK